MLDYGIIQQGKLVRTNKACPGAKPLVCEDVPVFDQETEYVIQLPPVDAGSHIYMGVEVHEMEQDEDETEG